MAWNRKGVTYVVTDAPCYEVDGDEIVDRYVGAEPSIFCSPPIMPAMLTGAWSRSSRRPGRSTAATWPAYCGRRCAMASRVFEDDFGWRARFDERPDGTVHGIVVTADRKPIWDREFPDMGTALAHFRLFYPNFQEVA